MADDKPLNDNQVHDRLHAAMEALGTADGETVHGDTALKSARRSLMLLQLAVVTAQAKGDAVNDNLKGPVEP
jgi:hypothetical protein